MFAPRLAPVALISLFLGTACGGESAPAPASGDDATTTAPAKAPAKAPAAVPGSTDAAGLKAAMDAGAVHLIDVRTPPEFAEGHAPGAKNLPLQELGSRMSELDSLKGEKVYLICASGGRSAAAQKELVTAGFADTVNVKGGTSGWVAAGYPVEK